MSSGSNQDTFARCRCSASLAIASRNEWCTIVFTHDVELLQFGRPGSPSSVIKHEQSRAVGLTGRTLKFDFETGISLTVPWSFMFGAETSVQRFLPELSFRNGSQRKNSQSDRCEQSFGQPARPFRPLTDPCPRRLNW